MLGRYAAPAGQLTMTVCGPSRRQAAVIVARAAGVKPTRTAVLVVGRGVAGWGCASRQSDLGPESGR